LSLLGVDVASAMDLWTEGYPPTRLPASTYRAPSLKLIAHSLYKPVYRLFIAYTIWCFLSWTIFRAVTRGDVYLVSKYGFIPGITALSVLLILACPYNVVLKSERDKFLNAIWRCLFPSTDSPIFFSDVVFADIATSFARVLGDMWLSIRMLLPGNNILTLPFDEGWARWVLPTVMSLPYLVRFRQCIVEYNHPANTSRRPLFNAIKYATSFPVIFLSAALHHNSQSLLEGYHIFQLWLLSAVINSSYSFWWDITNDWGLDILNYKSQDVSEQYFPVHRSDLARIHSETTLMREDSRSSEELSRPVSSPSPLRHRPKYPYGLREILFYPLPVYPLLIFFNLILRMTWSVRLSSHISAAREGFVAFLWLEIAEIARRWLWVFLRVEWEVIRKAQGDPKVRSDDYRDQEYELLPAAPESLHVQP